MREMCAVSLGELCKLCARNVELCKLVLREIAESWKSWMEGEL